MPTAIDYSIIIPDTDSTRMGQVLAALRKQDGGLENCEVLVVGSDSPALVQCDQVISFIPTGEEYSCASDKRNLGMHLAKGEIYLFLDDDCIPHEDWLQRHKQRHAQGELVVGGAVELAKRNIWQIADNLSAFHELLPYTRAGYRRYLCTSNLSIRRSVVEKVGQMEAHQNRADDLEWTARMRRNGISLYFEPQAVVLHDPQRCTAESVWRHWQVDAPNTLRVRLSYADELGTPRLARQRLMYLWGAPAVAAWATLRAFRHFRSIWDYGYTLPLIYLTKLVWCWSAYRNFPSPGGASSQ